ncbi:hypothetical protein [Sphingobium mellinum]|uniref:hypothetical protein n=1 Tax=Sphingobium mellinum TaxID=1387166 RepID=UPI0030EDA6E9
MKRLWKLALVAGLGSALWKSLSRRPSADVQDDRAPAGSFGIVRDAGPAEQHVDAADWDLVDEQMDESFPASDPPGNYRGVARSPLTHGGCP